MALADLAQRLEPVHARHLEVEHYDVDLDARDLLEGVGMGVRGDGGTVPIVIFSSEADRRLQTASTAVGARAAIAKADAERLVGEVMRILESLC
jgi:hypothetical protein